MFKYFYIAILTFHFTVIAEWPMVLAGAVSIAIVFSWNHYQKKWDKELEGQELPEELPAYPKN